jgi:hypothetical protein
VLIETFDFLLINQTGSLGLLASDVVGQVSGYVLEKIFYSGLIIFALIIVGLLLFARFSLAARMIIYILCGLPILYLSVASLYIEFELTTSLYIIGFSLIILLTALLPKIWPKKQN